MRALEILRGWQWGYYDPDSCWLGRTISLAEVINRLAFQEHDEPATAVLKLLCSGKVTAVCNYHWLKYQHATRYEVCEHMDRLSVSKWQALAEKLEEEERRIDAGEWDAHLVTLPKLELKDCPAFEWEPSSNRCAYAARPPDANVFGRNYYEESFSAWEIEIMYLPEEPTGADNFDGRSVTEAEPTNIQSNETANAMPPISQAELQKWWTSKSEVRDLLTQDELITLVRAKHPDKAISRDRVRELIGARKRGPKPLRGE